MRATPSRPADGRASGSTGPGHPGAAAPTGPHRRRGVLAACALAVGLLAAACTSHAAPTASADPDVRFAQDMIPHHEQALVMAALVPQASTNPAILDLGARIAAGQDPEIAQMRAWLAEWGAEPHSAMDHGTMDHAMGMLTAEELDRLESLQGAAFDQAFVELMIRHHEGAVAMAKDVLASGDDPRVKALAQQIITAQQAEIAEMRALAASGSPSTTGSATSSPTAAG